MSSSKHIKSCVRTRFIRVLELSSKDVKDSRAMSKVFMCPTAILTSISALKAGERENFNPVEDNKISVIGGVLIKFQF